LHLLSTINDILDLSKIEAGKLELNAVDFSLSAMLEDVRAMVLDSALTKNLSVDIDAGEVPPWLYGDVTRLRQGLLNYASNAVKFTEEGSIVLRARLLERQDNELRVRFEVQDTGLAFVLTSLGSFSKHSSKHMQTLPANTAVPG
jgi:two-component system, sensor histidine kinase and response regulator